MKFEALYQIMKIDDDLNENVLLETNDKARAYEMFVNPNEREMWHRDDVWMKQIDVYDDSWDVTYIGRDYTPTGYDNRSSYVHNYIRYETFDKANGIADRIIDNNVGWVGERNKIYIVGDNFTGSTIITTSTDCLDEWFDRTWEGGYDQEYVKDAVESFKKGFYGFSELDEHFMNADDFLCMAHSKTLYTNSEEDFSKSFSEIQKVFAEKQQRSSLHGEAAKCVLASEQMHQDKGSHNKHRSSEKDR